MTNRNLNRISLGIALLISGGGAGFYFTLGNIPVAFTNFMLALVWSVLLAHS